MLSIDQSTLATTMVSHIAETASRGEWSRSKDKNIAAASFGALQRVAKLRPEFRQASAIGVGTAITRVLSDVPLLYADAVLDTARLYADVFDQSSLRAVTACVLTRLEMVRSNPGSLPLVQPAVNYLHDVKDLLAGDAYSDLRHQVVSTLLRVSAANAADGTSFMWLLSELSPTEVSANVDPILLDTVLQGLCQRAMQSTSSGASANISALLTAPSISGVAGIRTALEGLLQILRTATSGRPAISFADTYNCIMVLTRKTAELEAVLGAGVETLDQANSQIVELLVQIWERAAVDPLVFRGFAIPLPTAPNRTVVHNWTFASVAFARSVGRGPEIGDALDAAARNAALEGPISVARAVEAPADDPVLLDPDRIASEKRDAFYAALGQRIVAISSLPLGKGASLLETLLDGCLRLGPRGEDSAVLALSLAAGITPSPSVGTSAYSRRLDNDRRLRLSLGPLWRRLTRGNDPT